MTQGKDVVWKPVIGYEGRYEVSNLGCVRNASGVNMTTWKSSFGYARVRLSGPRTVALVHRLVAQAFIPNPSHFPYINHIDCVRDNNAVENLEWCTQRMNLAHAKELGRMPNMHWLGKRSPAAKLDDKTAGLIREEYAAGGVSYAALAIKYGSNKRTVGRIVSRQTYV